MESGISLVKKVGGRDLFFPTPMGKSVIAIADTVGNEHYEIVGSASSVVQALPGKRRLYALGATEWALLITVDGWGYGHLLEFREGRIEEVNRFRLLGRYRGHVVGPAGKVLYCRNTGNTPPWGNSFQKYPGGFHPRFFQYVKTSILNRSLVIG